MDTILLILGLIALLAFMPHIMQVVLNYKKETIKKANASNQSEYIAVPLLTANEWNNYQRLKKYAQSHDLLICTKVRLADLVNPRPGTSHSIWKSRFYKICSKHVDFVLCNQNMEVKLIIELDDKSHEREDRIARDKFVDKTLEEEGYTILHTYVISDTTAEKLDEIFGPAKQPERKTDEMENLRLPKTVRTEPTYEEWKAAKLAEKAKQDQIAQ